MSERSVEPADFSEPVVVVGGGVVGLCCARSLARRGVPVVVLERGRVGHGASYGNAGTVSPGHPPINAPGRWRELLRSMIDPLSPLYIPPRLDLRLWRWLLSFARHCSRRHVEHSRAVMAPLARATPALHDEIAGNAGNAGNAGDGGGAHGTEEAVELGYRADGYLELYRTDAGSRTAEAGAEFARGQGFAPRRMSGDELREREPSLSGSVRGGFLYPEGRSLDPYAFVLLVADDARRHGARIETGVDVSGIRVERGRVRAVRTSAGDVGAASVVLATGAYSPELYRDLGHPLPVVPAKGYHVDLPLPATDAPGPDSACLLVETAVFCTPMPGRIRLAGTLEFSGINHDLREGRLRQLGLGARPYFDGLDEGRAVSRWCGLRPCTPDGLPVIGPVPGVRGAYAATGHAMLGLTFGPVTGELVAELIVEGRPSMPIDGLAPARF